MFVELEFLIVVATQIGIDDDRVAREIVGQRLRDHRALRHHDHPVGDIADDIHVVLDEHHRHPVVPQRFDVTQQALRQGRIDAGHGLVQHHHRRFGHQRASHLQQLALPPGQRPGGIIGLRGQTEPVEQFPGAPGDLAFLRPPRPRQQGGADPLAALMACPETHVVEHTHPRQRLRQLEGPHHPPPRHPVRMSAPQIVTVERPRPGVGAIEPGEQVEQGGLPGAVRSDQTRDTATLDLEVLDVDGLEAAERA